MATKWDREDRPGFCFDLDGPKTGKIVCEVGGIDPSEPAPTDAELKEKFYRLPRFSNEDRRPKR